MLNIQSIIDVAKKDAIEAMATFRPILDGTVTTKDLDDVEILLVGNDPIDAEGGKQLAQMDELMDGYEVLIYARALKDAAIWDQDHLWASPKEFATIKTSDARIIAKLVESIYHEMRHVFSAVLAAARDEGCWRSVYAIEGMKNGYWNNKYEKVAYKFQMRCWETVAKFVNSNGELKEEVAW